MTPERWMRLKALFDEALGLPPEQRARFAEEACEDDDELRRQLLALIASDAAPTTAFHFRGDPLGDTPAVGPGEEETLALAAGIVLEGKYRIEGSVGRGGMGEVYRATDLRLGRPVAVKVLPSSVSSDRERLRRFEQEARAAGRLNHPNILALHDIGTHEGAPYLVAELLKGESLREALARGRFSVATALDVALQVAQGLAAAHEEGILHRDIKPENLFVRSDGYVKILDFGLAKLTAAHPPATSKLSTVPAVSTEYGLVLGTPAFMSPEQARGDGLDARTDVWSLGVVLYEMVAGRNPFLGSTASDIVASILTYEPPPLGSAAEGVPAELDRIVTKSLAKERADRYGTAAELAVDLKQLKQQLELGVEQRTEPERPAPAGAPTNERSKPETRALRMTAGLVREVRRRGAALAITALALAVAGAAYALYLASPRRAIDSVAVLPLVNVGGDPEGEYLSDGITESLINSLSRLPGLRVMSRDTVFRLKGRDLDARAAGRELGIRAVLTGRVVQRGDALTISVELVDARDNSHIWGEQYSRRFADIFAIQQDIATSVTEKLRLELSGDDQLRLAKRYTENPEAYQLYLKGRYFWDKRPGDTVRKALECFNQAIELDPGYALAYAGLADAYLFSAAPLGRAEAMARARAAATKALAIDESLAEAHTTLGFVRMNYDFDWSGAEHDFKRALELNPKYPTAHAFYGYFLIASGRSAEEGLREVRRALELDPLSLALNWNVGVILYDVRRYDEAIEQFQKTIQLDPNHVAAHSGLADVYAQQRRFAEAIAEAQKVSSLRSDALVVIRVYVLAASGARDEARKLLQELIESRDRNTVNAYQIARVYVALGEKDMALRWLEKGYEERAFHMYFLGVDPAFDPLRSDERFRALLERIGPPGRAGTT